MPAEPEAVARAEPGKQSVHSSVVVHPIVLLSAVDHYNRVAKNTKRRVVGMLLGQTLKGVTDVTNSYAVPFEEDERDPNIWCAQRAQQSLLRRAGARRLFAPEAEAVYLATTARAPAHGVAHAAHHRRSRCA
jgi:hypothetical protein